MMETNEIAVSAAVITYHHQKEKVPNSPVDFCLEVWYN